MYPKCIIIFVKYYICIFFAVYLPQDCSTINNIDQIKFTRSSLDSSKRLGQLLDPRLSTSGTGT